MGTWVQILQWWWDGHELTWTTSVSDERQGNKRSVKQKVLIVRLYIQRIPGFNGFGDAPFSIQSRKFVCGGHTIPDKKGWKMLDFSTD